ncbi:MAG: cytochrome c [Chitinophagaceae bacterium]|nr:MAG: cytochrome c [Chitinophagaceae bacterium]
MKKIFVAGTLLLLFYSGTAFVQAYNLPQSVIRGKELYTTYCQNCHMEDGKGQAGVFPPLAKADYLKKTPVSKIIELVLKGQTGEITVNGTQYNAQMLAMDYLSDEQVADVLNYTYNSWGNKSLKAVTPAQVKKARQ